MAGRHKETSTILREQILRLDIIKDALRYDHLMSILSEVMWAEAVKTFARKENAKVRSAIVRELKKRIKKATDKGPKTVTGSAVAAGLERLKRDKGEIK